MKSTLKTEKIAHQKVLCITIYQEDSHNAMLKKNQEWKVKLALMKLVMAG